MNVPVTTDHLAIDAGVFADRRIELIRGALYEMPPISEAHAAATRYLGDLFITTLGPGRVLSRTQVILPSDGEPAPDLAVTERGAAIKPTAAGLGAP